MLKNQSAAAEKTRLQVLQSLHVLDEAPLPAFDCLVQATSVLCETPIALVSLVDGARLYFLAGAGLNVREVPRGNSLCDYAVRTPETMLEVPDASADPRFEDSPLVTGPPGIRFYAGVPLITTENEAVGTLCVIDHQRRELSQAQRLGLTALAEVTVQMLESRRRELVLAQALRQSTKN